jgi:hypothetical protein
VFNGLVRVADATGIQLDRGVLVDSADFRSALGVDAFSGAGNIATGAGARLESEVADRPAVSVSQLFKG